MFVPPPVLLCLLSPHSSFLRQVSRSAFPRALGTTYMAQSAFCHGTFCPRHVDDGWIDPPPARAVHVYACMHACMHECVHVHSPRHRLRLLLGGGGPLRCESLLRQLHVRTTVGPVFSVPSQELRRVFCWWVWHVAEVSGRVACGWARPMAWRRWWRYCDCTAAVGR